MADRYLIVNGDDFGLTTGVNEGIVEAHEKGVLTSTSLMVRRPAARDAAVLAKAHPGLGIGLHVDLGEWVYEGGAWTRVEEVVSDEDRESIAAEVLDQLRTFRRLLDRDPTHLDSHQHVHRDEPTRGILTDLAARLGIPLRGYTPGVSHCGAFYGQTGIGEPLPELIGVENLVRILEGLPAGVTELGCHPGNGHDPSLAYGPERSREVRTLCDPRVAEAIRTLGLELRSFADVDWRGPEQPQFNP